MPHFHTVELYYYFSVKSIISEYFSLFDFTFRAFAHVIRRNGDTSRKIALTYDVEWSRYQSITRYFHHCATLSAVLFKIQHLTKPQKSNFRWQGKKPQIQGAQIQWNEAYPDTLRYRG